MISWPDFEAMTPKEKGTLLRTPEGGLQAVVYSQQFDRPLLDHLIELAELIRSSHYHEQLRAYVKTLLATKSCALYFTQPSTRTFTSFSLAAQTVGMTTEEIRDPEMQAALFRALERRGAFRNFREALIRSPEEHTRWRARRREGTRRRLESFLESLGVEPASVPAEGAA